MAYLVAVGILMNISRQTKASTLDWMNNIGCDYEKRDS